MKKGKCTEAFYTSFGRVFRYGNGRAAAVSFEMNVHFVRVDFFLYDVTESAVADTLVYNTVGKNLTSVLAVIWYSLGTHHRRAYRRV